VKTVAHYCDANHCHVEVDAAKGVCPRHWAMLPPQMQARIYAVARQFKTRAQRLSSVEFLEAWADAIEFIAREEDNPPRNAFRGLAELVKRRQLGAADRTCQGKKAYSTFAQAERALAAVLRHDGAADTHMNVYSCRFCHAFHFGHSSSMSLKNRDQGREAKRA
jgi:hypothetical protein